jgi:hypothetical protein
MCLRRQVGFTGGAPEAAVEEKDGWVLGPRLLIKSSGKEGVTAYQIPSGRRYKDYRVKEEVLENVAVFKIYYVEANNEEEVRTLESFKSGRCVEGKLGADVNLPFGYTVNVGNFEAGAGNAVVKGQESIRVERSKHAALVVYGSTKKNSTFSRQKGKSNINVVLEVFLEEDTTPPQDIPPSLINAHSHTQPSPCAPHPPVNPSPASISASWPAVSSPSQEQLRRDYEAQLYEVRDEVRAVRASRDRLQRDYEDQLYDVRASRDRAASALAQKEAQLRTKEQEHQRLAEAHVASQAALKREREQLAAAAEARKAAATALAEREAQLYTKEQEYKRLVEDHAALQTTLEREREQLAAAAEARKAAATALAEREAQLYTKEQECKRLAEDHAALQTALEREREQSATAAEVHNTQLARQESLYQTAETARQTAASALERKEAQLYSKEQECERLVQEHAAAQAALEREREQSATAAEVHKTQLANQVLLYQRSEEALKQKERDYERLVEAYQQLAQVLVSSVVFGAEQWEQYFGKVGTAPRLPVGIGEVLSSPCPFWPGKQVKDTHLLVLVPSKVDDKPFSLNLLGELIRKPKAGVYSTKYRYYDKNIERVLGEQSFDCSYWVLMTRDVLPRSRKKSYGNQKGLIAAHVHYDVPYALEAATATLLHHACTGKRLYKADPWTYTRCQDLVSMEGGNYPTVVGGFNGSGLSVSYDFSDDSVDSYGVAGCRRFSRQP